MPIFGIRDFEGWTRSHPPRGVPTVKKISGLHNVIRTRNLVRTAELPKVHSQSKVERAVGRAVQGVQSFPQRGSDRSTETYFVHSAARVPTRGRQAFSLSLACFGRKKDRTDSVISGTRSTSTLPALLGNSHVASLYVRRNWGTLPKRASFCSLPQDDRTITTCREACIVVPFNFRIQSIRIRRAPPRPVPAIQPLFEAQSSGGAWLRAS